MKKSFDNPLVKLAVYLGLVWFTFWQPVIVIFWLKNGLTMADVMLLKSIHGIAVLLLEIPTGIITDRYGAKISFIFASAIYVLSLAVYSFGHSFYIFLIAEIIAAFGTALVSGSDSAYVYTFLDNQGNAEMFSEVIGKIHSFRLFSQTVAGILGGIIAHYFSLRLTLTLTIIPNALSFFIALKLPQIKALPKKEKGLFLIFGKGAKGLFGNPSSIRFSLNYILIAASGLLLFWLYQPYLKKIGVPIIYFGILTGTFNLTAMFFSSVSGKIKKFLGANFSILLINIMFVLSAFLTGTISSSFGFAFIFGLQAVRGMQSPVFYEQILNNVQPESRATAISMLNMLTRFSFIVAAPVLGKIVDKRGIFYGINITALFVGFAVVFIYISALNRLRSKNSRI